MSVYPIAQRESTAVVGVGEAAIAHKKTETTYVGDIRRTGVTVSIRKNYVARYNFAVRQYNSLPLPEKKRKMFGDLFLVHRYTIVIMWIICMAFGAASINTKALIAVPVVISLFILVVTIYNIVIFKKNRSILDDTLMIQNNDIGSINEWYTVPIHTRIENTAVAAAVGGDDSAAITTIRQQYTNRTDIQVMVYTDKYIIRYTYRPNKSFVLHITLFVIALVFAIAMAIA